MFASIIRVETGLAGGLCNFPEDLYGCGFQPWSQSTAGVQSQQLFQCIHLMFCSQISPSLEDSIKTSRSLGRERDPCSTLQLHNAGSCKWQVRYDKLTSQKFSCHELSHENIVLQSSQSQMQASNLHLFKSLSVSSANKHHLLNHTFTKNKSPSCSLK